MEAVKGCFRRPVPVRLEKRAVCCICREYIMPGQAYRYSNVDPKAITIKSLYSHVLCGDEKAEKRDGGTGVELSDEQILKFWAGMEELERRVHDGEA
jgi:hypothetical protein